QRERRLDQLAPILYGAPLAAFGTEHFTLTAAIASLVPSWMPWHMFWAYLIGACFIAAGLSFATGVLSRVSATAVAATFFLFVVLMDAPAWIQAPSDRIALVLTLRELSFCGGALALASRTTIARYFIAVPILVYSVEQFLHGDRVPAIPLDLITPTY